MPSPLYERMYWRWKTTTKLKECTVNFPITRHTNPTNLQFQFHSLPLAPFCTSSTKWPRLFAAKYKFAMKTYIKLTRITILLDLTIIVILTNNMIFTRYFYNWPIYAHNKPKHPQQSYIIIRYWTHHKYISSSLSIWIEFEPSFNRLETNTNRPKVGLYHIH